VRSLPLRSAGAFVVALVVAGAAIAGAQAQDGAGPAPPPPNAGVDYQIGGDYPLPGGASVVLRDWFAGAAAADPAYSICYVNAFQTQANEGGVDRPDERSNWPRRLVLRKLGDDPKWGGEYLVDLSTAKRRRAAAAWVAPMVASCAEKGFEGVEYDNLDSWTRFDDTPLARRVPFGKREALAYAKLIADHAHSVGLAVGQKNTPELSRAQVARAGFDFAIAEECGRYRECDRYVQLHDDRVIAIEYRRKDFRRACAAVGDAVSVVLRDRLVTKPGSRTYVYESC
jgi:hypothetical protein